MPLPLDDPQFWLVSALALGALALFLRPYFRRRRGGASEPACPHCAAGQAAARGSARRAARSSSS